MYSRELEDLDITREQFLTQLAATRELQSKQDDIQQQLDRTRNLLANQSSGDLLLLSYLGSRLQLLRELTTGDDFFNARAKYASWCLQQHSQLMENAKKHLTATKLALEVNHALRDECFHQCRAFLKDVIADVAEKDGGSSVPTTARRSSVVASSARRTSIAMPTTNTTGAQNRRGSIAPSKQRRGSIILDESSGGAPSSSIEQFKIRSQEIINKYNSEMKEEMIRQNQHSSTAVNSRSHVDNAKNTAKSTSIFGSINNAADFSDSPSVSTIGHAVTLHVNFDVESIPDAFSVIRSIASESRVANRSLVADDAANDQKKSNRESELHDLTNFSNEVEAGVRQFELNVCNHMESISNKTLLSVQKKFLRMSSNESEEGLFIIWMAKFIIILLSMYFNVDTPNYVTDIKWNLAQKYALVASGSEHIESIKNRLALEFEQRLSDSHEWMLQQQLDRLKRMQVCFSR